MEILKVLNAIFPMAFVNQCHFDISMYAFNAKQLKTFIFSYERSSDFLPE